MNCLNKILIFVMLLFVFSCKSNKDIPEVAEKESQTSGDSLNNHKSNSSNEIKANSKISNQSIIGNQNSNTNNPNGAKPR